MGQAHTSDSLTRLVFTHDEARARWLSLRSTLSITTFFGIDLKTFKSNQITFIVTSPQHKCLGEWNSYERAPDSAKKNKKTIYIWTDSAKKQQTIYIWTDSAKKQQTIYIWTDSAKKLHWSIYSASESAKKTTTIYIWTVHIYRLYRRQCAKYTYIYSVHIVYYKDTLNYQRHIIHRMGTSTLCTLSIHNVVYT